MRIVFVLQNMAALNDLLDESDLDAFDDDDDDDGDDDDDDYDDSSDMVSPVVRYPNSNEF